MVLIPLAPVTYMDFLVLGQSCLASPTATLPAMPQQGDVRDLAFKRGHASPFWILVVALGGWYMCELRLILSLPCWEIGGSSKVVLA